MFSNDAWRWLQTTVAESVTNDGSAFQTRAPATGNARSPIVVLRVGGTTTTICLSVCLSIRCTNRSMGRVSRNKFERMNEQITFLTAVEAVNYFNNAYKYFSQFLHRALTCWPATLQYEFCPSVCPSLCQLSHSDTVPKRYTRRYVKLSRLVTIYFYCLHINCVCICKL